MSSFLGGTLVTIRGLQSKAALNGTTATVASFNKDKGRFNVRCADGVIALKAENLEQDPAAVLPPTSAVDDPEYPMSEVLRVLDVVEADADKYNADVAVSCLSRCAQGLMDDSPPPELQPDRVVLAALHALQANSRNEGAAPQLYGVAILGLPFLLGERERAVLVESAEKQLECSLLGLLAKGLVWYKAQHELCSSTMIALRQLICCYCDADDDADFAGVDEGQLAALQSSGLLPALGGMLSQFPPSIHDEGALELHEHAIAVYSSVAGLRPSESRAAMLVEADAAHHALGAIRAGIEDVEGPKGQDAAEAALEMIRAACALLQALGQTEVGRDGLRRAGGVEVLGALQKLMPKAPAKEVAKLKARLLAQSAANDGGATPPEAPGRREASEQRPPAGEWKAPYTVSGARASGSGSGVQGAKGRKGTARAAAGPADTIEASYLY